MLDRIASFRQTVPLGRGVHVLLRPMVKEDRETLIEFFQKVPDEDLRFFRNNVHDRELVASWADNLDYRKVLPLLAFVNDRLAGDTTLHFGTGPERHLAWMRIYILPEMRNYGIGLSMLCALINLARESGIQQIVTEIPSCQYSPIKALRQMGFALIATFRDFFMTPNHETYDVDMLVLRLTHEGEDF